jgi:hypothetical protein
MKRKGHMKWRTGRLSNFLKATWSTCTEHTAVAAFTLQDVLLDEPMNPVGIIVTSHSFWPQRPNIESCVESCRIVSNRMILTRLTNRIMHKPNWRARQIPNAYVTYVYCTVLVFNIVQLCLPCKKWQDLSTRQIVSQCCCQFVFSPINVLQDWCVVRTMDRSGNRRPESKDSKQILYWTIPMSYYGIMPCWHNATIRIPVQADRTIYQILELVGEVEASWSVVTGLGVHRFSVDGWTERCPASPHLCMSRPSWQEHYHTTIYNTYLRVICMSKHCPNPPCARRNCEDMDATVTPHRSSIVKYYWVLGAYKLGVIAATLQSWSWQFLCHPFPGSCHKASPADRQAENRNGVRFDS